MDSGRCADNREPVAAWYYDEYTGKCTAFAYSGCDGNANRFDTEEQCERQCGQFKGQGNLSFSISYQSFSLNSCTVELKTIEL